MKMDIARGLIEKGCVKLSPQNPFTYASGLRGPVYCDNRLILSHVDFREKIIQSFLDVIKKDSLQFDLIGGIATAGIPYAAFIADRLKLPMVYVRPKAKEHGKKNQVEGDYRPNQSVILVEDLVNQGSSLAEAMSGVRDAGLFSTQCLCIVDYQMSEAKKRLKELSLSLISLTDFDHLIQAALEMKLIDSEGKKLLIDWHADPKEWSRVF
ncbi:MAG: orotate phosphoribosyltransferase [Bacteriovorax sp.]|nr:orotate phosphoribosyltransferase [Bacteriovorax sp.]